VSHHHYRKDKTCLNCGATVQERFCSRCGQENLEPKESFGHLVVHFFSDLTHFDSGLFITIKDLILKPGFLTQQYIAGKRVSYLNPIRMYVFISAVFFLALFAGNEKNDLLENDNQHANNLARQQLADSLRKAEKTNQILSYSDSIRNNIYKELAANLDTTKFADSSESVSIRFSENGTVIVDLVENKYHNVREYDSIQQMLPDSARNKGTLNWLLRNNARQKALHGGRNHIVLEQNVQHDIPKIMFVLLPLFAFFVGFFYSRKQYFYVQHVIFSVHFHSFVFLIFLLMIIIGWIAPGEFIGVIGFILSILLIFIYLVAALKRMYQQSIWLSLLKGLAISILYLLAVFASVWSLLVISFLRA